MKPLFPDAKPAAHTLTKDANPVDIGALDLGNGLSVVGPASLPAVVAPTARSVVKPMLVTMEQVDKLGENARSGLTTVSSTLNKGVRAVDADEFGASLNKLVMQAKGLDPRTMGQGLLARARGLLSSTKERMVAQYNSVETQMDKLIVELSRHSTLHGQRVIDMETLYEDNVRYHNELEAAAIEGDDMLLGLQAYYDEQSKVAANDSFGAQKLADVQRVIDRLGKRVDDLRRTMLLSKQFAPQIRMMQDNARGLVDKFGDIKTLTLPAFKNNFTLYLLQLEQKHSVELATAVEDATDAALRRGADLLHQNTEAIARARQRSVVSLETLEYVQQNLISSVDIVKQVNDEGKAARAAAAPKLLELERELVSRFAPGQR